jgi:muramoyltetrapeptide carboxypeptidase
MDGMINTPLLLPPALKRGAHIRVIAPSGPVPPEHLELGLGILEKHFGFTFSVDDNAYTRDRYFSAPDPQRLLGLHHALDDPSVDGIWCARGGYGAMRIAPLIDPEKLRRRPVPLVGFSDITVLHQVFNQAGVSTFHGPVITQLSRLDDASLEQTRQVLMGEESGLRWTMPEAQILTAGTAKGPLMGGNLSILASLAGTQWQPDFTDAVVFLEDVGEPCYRCDRMVQQLLQSCGLQNASALLLGDFTRSPADDASWFDALWSELAAKIQGPVLRGLPIGHSERNRTVPMGINASVDSNHLQLTLKSLPGHLA